MNCSKLMCATKIHKDLSGRDWMGETDRSSPCLCRNLRQNEYTHQNRTSEGMLGHLLAFSCTPFQVGDLNCPLLENWESSFLY